MNITKCRCFPLVLLVATKISKNIPKKKTNFPIMLMLRMSSVVFVVA